MDNEQCQTRIQEKKKKLKTCKETKRDWERESKPTLTQEIEEEEVVFVDLFISVN